MIDKVGDPGGGSSYQGGGGDNGEDSKAVRIRYSVFRLGKGDGKGTSKELELLRRVKLKMMYEDITT